MSSSANTPPAAGAAAESTKKSRVLDLASSHPYILAAIVMVIVIVVLWLVFKDHYKEGLSSLVKGGKRKTDGSSDERRQILDLISSIEKKQKDSAENEDK
jgi:hypothetical protein